MTVRITGQDLGDLLHWRYTFKVRRHEQLVEKVLNMNEEPEEHPSGAKCLGRFDCVYGTAEAVPFQNNIATSVLQQTVEPCAFKTDRHQMQKCSKRKIRVEFSSHWQ
jgi:hypothetical protein